MLLRHTLCEMQILKDPNVKCPIFSESQGSVRGWFEYDLVRCSDIRSGYHIGEILYQELSWKCGEIGFCKGLTKFTCEP